MLAAVARKDAHKDQLVFQEDYHRVFVVIFRNSRCVAGSVCASPRSDDDALTKRAHWSRRDTLSASRCNCKPRATSPRLTGGSVNVTSCSALVFSRCSTSRAHLLALFWRFVAFLRLSHFSLITVSFVTNYLVIIFEFISMKVFCLSVGRCVFWDAVRILLS